MNDDRPFAPYDVPGPDGLPLTGDRPKGIPIPQNSRRLAKDVTKLAKLKTVPKLRKPKFKSDVKYY